jgi:N-acetylneuraminic acid mutarotase
VIIATGGWDGDRPVNSVEIFDPSKGEWAAGPPMPEPRRDHGAVLLGDSLYCVGGWGLDPYYNSVVRLDLRSMAWAPAPPLPSPRGWPGVAVLNDQLYCAGGYDERDKALSVVERFSPHTNRWEKVDSLDQKRAGCGLVAINGLLFAIGGNDGKKALKSVERFDPRENKWRKVCSLSQGRREDLSHACVVYNGSILLMGGQGEDEQVLDSGEIYSLASDSWSPAPTRLTRGKRGLSLAVAGGVVFAVGGEDRDDQNLHTVMMLDSQTGAWVEWHPMRGMRAGHAVGVVRKEQMGGMGAPMGGMGAPIGSGK